MRSPRVSPAAYVAGAKLRYSLKFAAYMSASACFFAWSSTTIQCQPWLFEPVGAWIAISMHSSTIERSTGRSKSRRFRTDRVVVSTSSAVRFRCIAGVCQRRATMFGVDERDAPDPGDYQRLNRSNWASRVAHHTASTEYGLERFTSDPAHLSGVVRFDLP